MSDDPKTPSNDELSHRLDALKSRLGESVNQADSVEKDKPSADKTGMAMAFRLSSEFIGGVLVGGAIGYGLDFVLGTGPWGMIVFLLFGFCAAILNVLRSSGMVAESGLEGHKEPSSAQADKPARSTNRDRTGTDR